MWEEKNKKLTKTYVFKDFNQALEFVNKIGKLAENKQHHPDILIHGYNKVTLTLSTHDKGCITEKDHELAKEIDKL